MKPLRQLKNGFIYEAMADPKPLPVRDIKPFGLRLQPKLKALLEEAARKNARSLNAEISERLQMTFEQTPQEMIELLSEYIDAKLAEKGRARKDMPSFAEWMSSRDTRSKE